MKRILETVGRIGGSADDTEESARAKRLLVAMSLMVTGLASFWVLLYWIYEEHLAASIPAVYMGLSVVNTASRMESHSEDGMIQVAESAYNQLKDEFICQPRGVIDVKGKGPMTTWYLIGRRA